MEPYDIIVDASDNPATRYLVNDVSVLLGKPLVSGSALRMEGQITVYHFQGGPCYRCIFPQPPPPHTVTNCGDGGVLGAIPGIIGTMQALECIKVAIALKKTNAMATAATTLTATTTTTTTTTTAQPPSMPTLREQMMLFDGGTGRVRTVRLRPRRSECAVCGDRPTIIDPTELPDYEAFCGRGACDKTTEKSLLHRDQRVTCQVRAAVRTTVSHSHSLTLTLTLPFSIIVLPPGGRLQCRAASPAGRP